MKKILIAGGHEVKIDDDDFKKVSNYIWRALKARNGQHYAVTDHVIDGGRKYLSMHRLISGDPENSVVHHINGKTLDNRRKNLQTCSIRQHNQMPKPRQNKTTSKYLGVYKVRTTGNWRSMIFVKGERITLGTFDDEFMAALAYDFASIRYHGKTAVTNFII